MLLISNAKFKASFSNLAIFDIRPHVRTSIQPQAMRYEVLFEQFNKSAKRESKGVYLAPWALLDIYPSTLVTQQMRLVVFSNLYINRI